MAEPARWYFAIVVSNEDPYMAGRLLVNVPDFAGGTRETWGWVSPLDSAALRKLPKEDDIISVLVTPDREGYMGTWAVQRPLYRVDLEGNMTDAQFTEGRDALQAEVVDDNGTTVEWVLDPDKPETFVEQAAEARAQGKPSLVQLADAAAARHNIPIMMFRGLVQTESSWKPRANSGSVIQGNGNTVSHNNWNAYSRRNTKIGGRLLSTHALWNDQTAWGAYGLTQVLLATALEHGLGFDADGPTVLYNPERNLEIGAKYLAVCHRIALKRGGSWDLALAMYNGGFGKKSGKFTSNTTTWYPGMRAYVKKIRKWEAKEAAGVGPSAKFAPSAVGIPDETTAGLNRTQVTVPAINVPKPSLTDPDEIVLVTTAPAENVNLPYAYWGTEYPNSTAIKWGDSPGHIIEVDETSGAERIRFGHVAGQYLEFGPGGQVLLHGSSRYDSVEGRRLNTSGTHVDVCDGDRKTATIGIDRKISERDAEWQVGGDLSLNVGRRYIVNVNGDTREDVRGTKTISAIGPLRLVGVSAEIGAVRDIFLRANRGEIELLANKGIRLLSGTGDVEIGVPTPTGRVTLGALGLNIVTDKEKIVLKPSLDKIVELLTAIVSALNLVNPLLSTPEAITTNLVNINYLTTMLEAALLSGVADSGGRNMYTTFTEAD